MNTQNLGWLLLIGGGIGVVVSAIIGSDWPMYASIIVSSVGVAVIMITRKTKKAT